MQERRPYRVTDCPLRGPLSSYYLSGSSSPPPHLLSLKLQSVEVAGRNGFNGLINFDLILHITEKPYMAHDLKSEQYAFEFIFITGNSGCFLFFLTVWMTKERTVFAGVRFCMQPTAKSSLPPNNGNQMVSMQKCTAGRKAAAWM